MITLFRERSWSPYLVGAGIGLLSWFAFASADHPIGVTTAFEQAAAFITGATHLTPTSYKPETPTRVDWEWALVIGIFFGSLLSARLSGDRSGPTVPPAWAARFGSRTSVRMAGAFLGGALMMYGARLAGGCTSGHSISGTMQFAISSWVFTAVFFPVSILTTHLLYGRRAA